MLAGGMEAEADVAGVWMPSYLASAKKYNTRGITISLADLTKWVARQPMNQPTTDLMPGTNPGNPDCFRILRTWPRPSSPT
jgi:hypothetical protein